MPRRDHVSAKWARIGARVAKLPPRLVRRLLSTVDTLTTCESEIRAMEAVRAFSEVLSGRPQELQLLESLESLAATASALAQREALRRRRGRKM
jgi:hypothetical protein